MDESKSIEAGRLIVRNPLIIEKVREEGERPLCYYRRWRSLSLRSSNYEVQRIFHGLNRGDESIFDDFDMDFQLDPEKLNDEERREEEERREFKDLARRAREDYESLSDEEKREFQHHHLKKVKASEKPAEYQLIAWCDIEGLRSIQLLDENNENADIEQRYSFTTIKLVVRALDEHHVGSLMHWTKDLRRYDRDDPGKDYLLAEVYLKRDMLEEVCEAALSRDEKPELRCQVQAFLFQYEVDESLAEPWFFQSYAMQTNSSTSIFVEAISLGSAPHTKIAGSLLEDEENEGEGGLFYEPPPDPEEEFRVAVREHMKGLSESLTQVKYALLVIAAVAVFSLFS